MNCMINLSTEELLDSIKEWIDPSPAPIIEEHNGFYVVRDDKLGYGSKARFIDYLVSKEGSEWVFGGANKVGWGPISLTHVCNKYGKKATFFMAKRTVPTWHQQQVLNMGGTIHWIANQTAGFLLCLQSIATSPAKSNCVKIISAHSW